MEIADEGSGRPILVVHGGMGDLSSWRKVTERLRGRFRTIRVHRRQYRLDMPRKVTMADEVAETNTVVERSIIVGHSSGAVLALEALVADPGRYTAAVLYEPPVVIDRPLGGDRVVRARAALAAGRPGDAWAIFMREIAGLWNPIFALARFTINRNRTIAPLIERQLDDNDAIDELGNRLDVYRTIDVPVLLIAGERSPRHLLDRLDALQAVLPRARRVTLPGEGHTAERSAPAKLAEAIAEFAESLESGDPPSRPDA
ncbi:alpha/beta fold hydrolase [Paractinoplanes ferrugineus]|uniref:Hydrolase n=1 Tax=Paractinoplanes ferrugineus TaxID=113564 RepID=A0A919MDX9_9ACTN|nr:alpha/beta hydrolase [Actinoplanes ferrugineus]GIE08970.1 hydrolase [Actinoplanes ferrugineus]